jgi:hypothetical protein
MVLLIRELLPPLLFCFGNFFHLTSLLTNRTIDKDMLDTATEKWMGCLPSGALASSAVTFVAILEHHFVIVAGYCPHFLMTPP